MFRKTPDDSFFEEMDEWVWTWMYQSWLQDREDDFEKYKDFAIFVGSFSNPQMAQDIIKKSAPDFKVSDKDYQKSIDAIDSIGEILAMKEKAEKKMESRKRRRSVVKE